jgi:hypothetical protein
MSNGFLSMCSKSKLFYRIFSSQKYSSFSKKKKRKLKKIPTKKKIPKKRKKKSLVSKHFEDVFEN